MQGFQITAYVGDSVEWPSDCKRPRHADTIVKSWEPTRTRAELEKERLEVEHGGIVVIES